MWLPFPSSTASGELTARISIFFTYFLLICSSNPATIMISVGNSRKKLEKDTLRNIVMQKEFVVNSAQLDFGQDLNASSAELDYGVSELDVTSLTTAPSHKIKTPKIAQSKWSFECKLSHMHQVGDPNEIGSSRLILGEIVYVEIDDAIFTPDDRSSFVDVDKLNPLARLSGANYCSLGEPFKMKRPK